MADITRIRRIEVSTHSRPKAAGKRQRQQDDREIVSTHSRPKAAGLIYAAATVKAKSFNSQPPEGGWILIKPLY